MELPIYTSKIYHNFLYSKKRTPGLNYAEKDGQPQREHSKSILMSGETNFFRLSSDPDP
jgi:hypothetical protein